MNERHKLILFCFVDTLNDTQKEKGRHSMAEADKSGIWMPTLTEDLFCVI
jgi:hypothetical protein